MRTIWKKGILVCMLLGLSVGYLVAQESDCEKEMQQLIRKYCFFSEMSLSWQDEADKLNALFVEALENNYYDNYNEAFLSQVLFLLYDNYRYVFEDSPDARRIPERRSLCYLTLALASDDWRDEAFIKDAHSCFDNAYDNYDKEKFMIDMVNLYLIIKHKQDYYSVKDEIKGIEARFTACKNEIYDKAFIEEYTLLLQKLRKAFP